MDSLASVGVHFTLCRQDNPKAAVRGDYLTNAPSSAQVINHVRQGLPIGIIPYSCNSAVVDVDAGNHKHISDEHPPFLIYPSTSGYPKAHLWYRVGKPRNQNQFSFLTCAGQIISSNHVAFPNPETNLVALYQAFLNPSNSTYILPPIPPLPSYPDGVGVLGVGASLSPSLPPLIAQLPLGQRHNGLLRALVGWIKANKTKPSPSEIRDQSLFLRDTLDDVRDFGTPEVLAISEWAIRKVQAGDIRRELTTEQRRHGGLKRAFLARQHNFQRDKRILALHHAGLSNRAIAKEVGLSHVRVGTIIDRDG